MKSNAPPEVLQRLLRVLLVPRDRETVAGDLYEEYCKQRLPRFGSFRANSWYAAQVLSFATRWLGTFLVQSPTLTLVCVFTAICGSWLGTMDLLLKHPGYAAREIIAGVIVGEAMLTLGALRFRQNTRLRALAMMGCMATLWLASRALIGVVRGAGVEGYVFIIALALVLQAVLTLLTLRKKPVELA